MRPGYPARVVRPWWRRPGPLTAAIKATTVLVAGVLVASGLITLPGWRTPQRSTDGLVPVPVAARPIPAYSRIVRDHFWNPQAQRLAVVYLPPATVTPDMIVRLGDILGRVLDHDKPAGFVFTESDFLPKGTREGLVAGIPPGKRALRVESERVDGLFGLRAGDRFDLVATLPIDAKGGQSAFDVGGTYGAQLALQARLSNWQKQATVHVLVQNGVVVEPMTTRQVPVFARSLTQGAITRMRPVQETVIAVAPDEVARLTEAMAVEAKIATVPRSGRPGDELDSVTPDLTPVSPFSSPTAPGAAAGGPTGPFSMVEHIAGGQRGLMAVPKQ